MIPKIIHYCWFGGQIMPRDLKNCLKTWEQLLPDFVIIRWDEQNAPIEIPFAKQAYKEKKWAFVADYIRFWVLYHYGGVYLDTDMYLLKRLDDLLDHQCFIGAENPNVVSCGIIGAEPKHWFTETCLRTYQTLEFDPVFYPLVNNICTNILRKRGFHSVEKITKLHDLVIYPANFFYPYPYPPRDDASFKKFVRPESITIHLWKSSWHPIWKEFIEKRYIRGTKKLIEEFRNNSGQNLKFFIKSIYYLFFLNRIRANLICLEEKLFLFLILQNPLTGFLASFLSYKKKILVLSKIDQLKVKPLSTIINRLDIKYKVDLYEHNSWRIFYLMFLNSTFDFFKQINPEDNIIDVGANIGFYTLMSAKRASNGKVFSIEPDQDNFSSLIRNIELNQFKNIFPSLLALGEKNSKVILESFSSDDNNGLKRIRNNQNNQEPDIQMMTLDHFVEENKISKIDWIKIDIEGYEHELLKGALKTIAKFKPNFFLEICDQHLKHYNSSANKLVEAFEDMGYKVIHADLNREISSNFYLEGCFFDAFCYTRQ